MKKLFFLSAVLCSIGMFAQQRITDVKLSSDYYSVYVNGDYCCSPAGRNSKLIGFGNDFVVFEYNHIYFVYGVDLNCNSGCDKTISSKYASNIEIIEVSGDRIKTKQTNGIYYYDKYWKSVY